MFNDRKHLSMTRRKKTTVDLCCIITPCRKNSFKEWLENSRWSTFKRTDANIWVITISAAGLHRLRLNPVSPSCNTTPNASVTFLQTQITGSEARLYARLYGLPIRLKAEDKKRPNYLKCYEIHLGCIYEIHFFKSKSNNWDSKIYNYFSFPLVLYWFKICTLCYPYFPAS